jgi:hypothetical protein
MALVLKLVGVQLISLNTPAGVDTGDMSTEDVAALFWYYTRIQKRLNLMFTPTETEPEEDDF